MGTRFEAMGYHVHSEDFSDVETEHSEDFSDVETELFHAMTGEHSERSSPPNVVTKLLHEQQDKTLLLARANVDQMTHHDKLGNQNAPHGACL